MARTRNFPSSVTPQTDVWEFYETTLLSEDISVQEKTSIALDIAMRWEQIDSSSTALSANSLLERLKPDVLVPSARSHSLHHIEGSTRDKVTYKNLPRVLRRINLTSPDGNHSSSAVLADNGELKKNHVPVAETTHSSLDSSCLRLQTESTFYQPKASAPPRRPRRHRRLLSDEPNHLEGKEVGGAPSPSTSSSLESFRRLAGSGQTFHMQLVRSPSDGFGFSIAGGSDQEPRFDGCVQGFVYVAHITPGGVADKDGRLAHEEATFEKYLASSLSIHNPERYRMTSIKSTNRAEEDEEGEGEEEEEGDFAPLRPRISRAPGVALVTDSPKSTFSASSGGPFAKPGSQGSLSVGAIGGPGEASYLPTTVTPLSSIFTMPCGAQAVRRTSEAQRIKPSPRRHRANVGKQTRPLHPPRDTDAGLSDDSQDVWLFDPESTLGGHASISTKSPAKMGSCEDLPGSLSRRPLPAPSPGPVIVEVPLVRGTRNGFGFSIAGGRDSQYVEGDSGIFITQVSKGWTFRKMRSTTNKKI
ncbi:unnamed protein product [Schistocephalus solidus]|uniref:PDZ domain-containing protein n=1 Tax=Schistocephalus solidus TaxID=70667 RepID=A0A183T5E2_SCHSO|nr:unnamed protein product [Schistocephalus solidus]